MNLPSSMSSQEALAEALGAQHGVKVRQALARGASLSRLLPGGGHPLYYMLSLVGDKPAIMRMALAHARRHPEQWQAARRYRDPHSGEGPVHWLVKQEYFSNHPEVFQLWENLGLNLSRQRSIPLLSMCAPEMVGVLVDKGLSLYLADRQGRTPLFHCLSLWSGCVGHAANIDYFVARRQSRMIEAFLAAGWSPAQDPCLRSIRLLSGRLSKRLMAVSAPMSQLPGVSALQSRLRHHALSARTIRPSQAYTPRCRL